MALGARGLLMGNIVKRIERFGKKEASFSEQIKEAHDRFFQIREIDIDPSRCRLRGFFYESFVAQGIFNRALKFEDVFGLSLRIGEEKLQNSAGFPRRNPAFTNQVIDVIEILMPRG